MKKIFNDHRATSYKTGDIPFKCGSFQGLSQLHIRVVTDLLRLKQKTPVIAGVFYSIRFYVSIETFCFSELIN